MINKTVQRWTNERLVMSNGGKRLNAILTLTTCGRFTNESKHLFALLLQTDPCAELDEIKRALSGAVNPLTPDFRESVRVLRAYIDFTGGHEVFALLREFRISSEGFRNGRSKFHVLAFITALEFMQTDHVKHENLNEIERVFRLSCIQLQGTNQMGIAQLVGNHDLSGVRSYISETVVKIRDLGKIPVLQSLFETLCKQGLNIEPNSLLGILLQEYATKMATAVAESTSIGLAVQLGNTFLEVRGQKTHGN